MPPLLTHCFFFIYLSFYGNNTETKLELIGSCPYYPTRLYSVCCKTRAGSSSQKIGDGFFWTLAIDQFSTHLSTVRAKVKSGVSYSQHGATTLECCENRKCLSVYQICHHRSKMKHLVSVSVTHETSASFPFKNMIHVKKTSQTHSSVPSCIPVGGLIRPIVGLSADFIHYV